MYGLHNLSNKERDLYLFAETAGLSMNPRILRILLELLQENATPASIIQMLNELATFRIQEKTRRQKLAKASLNDK